MNGNADTANLRTNSREEDGRRKKIYTNQKLGHTDKHANASIEENGTELLNT